RVLPYGRQLRDGPEFLRYGAHERSANRPVKFDERRERRFRVRRQQPLPHRQLQCGQLRRGRFIQAATGILGVRPMHDELYADGVSEITVGGPIVLIDLFSLSPLERDADNVPKKIFRQRLIFPAQGFANAVDVMQRALQGLVEAGVVKRTPPHLVESPPIVSTDERSASTPISSTRSPNASSNFR